MISRIVTGGAAIDSISATVTIDGTKYQAVEFAINDAVNQTYEITAQIVLSKNQHFKPKLKADASVEVEFCGQKRAIKNAVLWAAGQLQQGTIKESTGDRRAQLWVVKLHPKLSVLSHDLRSEVYEGDYGEILGTLKKEFGIGSKTFDGVGSGGKQQVARYRQTALDFWDMLVARSRGQYYFKDNDLIVCSKFSSGSTYKIDDRDIVSIASIQQSVVGKVRVNLHQRDKSIKSEELSARVTDCKSVYEESGLVDNKRHLQIQQCMNHTGADRIHITVVNQIAIGVGDVVDLEVKSTQTKGKYYVLSAEHHLAVRDDEELPYWHCKSTLVLSLQPDAPMLKVADYSKCIHRAVIVGEKDEKAGAVVVDKLGKVNINYLWQSSKVKLKAYIAMPSCGGDGRGIVSFPRVGDEVIVDCIDGDLAQPVVIGVITSAANPIPLKLPTESSVTLWRTKSLGEAKKDARPNEMLFDDAKEKERVWLTAARDYKLHVEHEYLEQVVGKRRCEFGDDCTTVVKKQKDERASDTLTIENGDHKILLNGKGSESSLYLKDGKITQQVDRGDCFLKLKSGNKNDTLDKGDYTEKIGGAKTIEAKSATIKCGGSVITVDGSGVKIKATSIDLAGTNINIKATGKLNMQGMSVAIKGTTGVTADSTGKVNINGSMVGVNGKAKLDLASNGMTSVSASGITKVSGGLLKLN